MVTKLVHASFMFKTFSPEDMETLSSILESANFEQGQEIFSQNDSADSMYFIKYGTVQVSHRTESGDDLQVAVLGTGSHFGEMSFLDVARRMATATAVEHTEVVRINFKSLQKLFEVHPSLASKFHQAVAQTLASRLRTTTRDLSRKANKALHL